MFPIPSGLGIDRPNTHQLVHQVRPVRVAHAREPKHDRAHSHVAWQRHAEHRSVQAGNGCAERVARDEHVLEPVVLERALDGGEDEVGGAALRGLEARVQLDAAVGLREERRVGVDLLELDVVRDREELFRVRALVRDDDRLRVRVLRDEDCRVVSYMRAAREGGIIDQNGWFQLACVRDRSARAEVENTCARARATFETKRGMCARDAQTKTRHGMRTRLEEAG